MDPAEGILIHLLVFPEARLPLIRSVLLLFIPPAPPPLNPPAPPPFRPPPFGPPVPPPLRCLLFIPPVPPPLRPRVMARRPWLGTPWAWVDGEAATRPFSLPRPRARRLDGHMQGHNGQLTSSIHSKKLGEAVLPNVFVQNKESQKKLLFHRSQSQSCFFTSQSRAKRALNVKSLRYKIGSYWL